MAVIIMPSLYQYDFDCQFEFFIWHRNFQKFPYLRLLCHMLRSILVDYDTIKAVFIMIYNDISFE